jgi:hypothetical protein
MKSISIIVIFCLTSFSLLSQTSKIENTQVKISSALDTMYIKYDFTCKVKAGTIKLEVTDQKNKSIQPKNIFGDVGKGVKPGKDKIIIWDINADGLDFSGSSLKVKVIGNVYIPPVKKKVWIQWFYVAAGASAVTGTYANIRANQLYDDYSQSSKTNEAENIHSDAENMLKLSRIAFGAAAVFGTAGIIVHIRHNRHKDSFALNYSTFKDANSIILTYKF